MTKTVKHEILLVEGWLQKDELEQAKKEFLQHGYQFILTTGFPHTNGFTMGSGGKLLIRTDNLVPASNDSIYDIKLITRGTKVDNTYAHYKLFVDSLEIGEGFSTKQLNSFSKKLKLNNPPVSVAVEFDNDTYTTFRDRNLIVHAISINNQIFEPYGENAAYYIRRKGVYYLHQRLSPGSAQDAANYLISAGIPDSLVIPVTTTIKIKSKTYTTALDAKQWLDQNGLLTKPAVTIFTEGMHARRSFISFKKAFGESADIGVISCPNKYSTGKNWWKTRRGWRFVLYETVGYFYALIML